MKDLACSIFNIFRSAGRVISFIRNAVLNTVFLVFILIIVLSLIPSSKDTIIHEDSVLLLSLRGDVVEERRHPDGLELLMEESFGQDKADSTMVLQDILDVIQSAAHDQKITAIRLDLKHLKNIGLNQMQEIGKALENFKQQNKKIIAAEDFYTQKMYYLASFGDSIIINPMGGVDLHGFGLYRLYFKDALEKLKINYHVFRAGSYKSAVEPITRNSMSPEARQQNLSWLEELWGEYTDDIVRQRSLPQGTIQEYIDNIPSKLASSGGDLAQLALDTNLVDHILTREQTRSFIQNELQLSGPISYIPFEEYQSGVIHSYSATPTHRNTVAIIVAEGNIITGKQPAGVIGSESLVKMLRSARKDSGTKAVVLRLNSGGGSAFASEIIRQEILQLKKTGKPIIISMGSMAASGGYWISADADQIFASPTTLTGSIGIFGAVPTFENSLASLGVHGDGVGTTSLSSATNLTVPMTPQLKQSIQLTVDNGYERFLSIVSQGRNLPLEDLSELAEGRVFTGARAKELKLVDQLGNLEDAVAEAASLAGLDEYEARYLERESSFKERIFQHLSGYVATISLKFIKDNSLVKNLLYQAKNELLQLSFLEDPNHTYAHALLPVVY